MPAFVFQSLDTHPVAGEASSSRQCKITDVGWTRTGDRLVDDQRAVLHLGAAGLLHLPELLQLFDDIHWIRKKERCT